MSTHRIPLLAATFLLSAAAIAAQAEPATPAPAPIPAPAQPAATQAAPQPQANAAPQERLRIGLSDSGTKLVLPWFVTELTDAVNQGKSLNETGKALANGL